MKREEGKRIKVGNVGPLFECGSAKGKKRGKSGRVQKKKREEGRKRGLLFALIFQPPVRPGREEREGNLWGRGGSAHSPAVDQGQEHLRGRKGREGSRCRPRSTLFKGLEKRVVEKRGRKGKRGGGRGEKATFCDFCFPMSLLERKKKKGKKGCGRERGNTEKKRKRGKRRRKIVRTVPLFTLIKSDGRANWEGKPEGDHRVEEKKKKRRRGGRTPPTIPSYVGVGGERKEVEWKRGKRKGDEWNLYSLSSSYCGQRGGEEKTLPGKRKKRKKRRILYSQPRPGARNKGERRNQECENGGKKKGGGEKDSSLLTSPYHVTEGKDGESERRGRTEEKGEKNNAAAYQSLDSLHLLHNRRKKRGSRT